MSDQTGIGTQIFKAVFQLSNRIQVEGDKIAPDLTLKQWYLLLLLCRGKMQNVTVNKLASAMGVTRQSTKKMIAILQKSSYVAVNQSQTDSRALCIEPTHKAFDFFKQNQSLGYDLLHRMLEGISQEELETALRLLNKMQNNLQKREEASDLVEP